MSLGREWFELVYRALGESPIFVYDRRAERDGNDPAKEIALTWDAEDVANIHDLAAPPSITAEE